MSGLSAGIADAEEVSLTSTNWEPYNGELLPNYGFASEIISEAFKRVGYKVSFTFLPWNRAYKDTIKGKYDGLFASYYSKKRAEIFAPSDPYISGPLVLCSRQETEIKFKTLRDLSSYTIGVVRGYVNTPEFDKADYLKKEEVNSDILNLIKLIRGRVDLIVIDKYTALYYLKNAPSVQGDLNNVRFLSPPLEEKPLHIMFSKAVSDYKLKLDGFNRGLREIKADGTFEGILRKYGFSNQN
jgi:polar amino acid transport system substrate-binding protein